MSSHQPPSEGSDTSFCASVYTHERPNVLCGVITDVNLHRFTLHQHLTAHRALTETPLLLGLRSPIPHTRRTPTGACHSPPTDHTPQPCRHAAECPRPATRIGTDHSYSLQQPIYPDRHHPRDSASPRGTADHSSPRTLVGCHPNRQLHLSRHSPN